MPGVERRPRRRRSDPRGSAPHVPQRRTFTPERRPLARRTYNRRMPLAVTIVLMVAGMVAAVANATFLIRARSRRMQELGRGLGLTFWQSDFRSNQKLSGTFQGHPVQVVFHGG